MVQQQYDEDRCEHVSKLERSCIVSRRVPLTRDYESGGG